MKYKLPIAFFIVITIWTTTPLAIKWSSDGVSFTFALMSRMIIGVICAYILLRFLGMTLPWNKTVRRTYLAASFNIYFAMMLIYWASQFIPSGWVAVIFGLAPMITGIIAYKVLSEDALTPAKIFGSCIALIGLSIIFLTGEEATSLSVYAMSAVLLSTIIHSVCTVWVKQLDAVVSPLATTTGALLYAVPAFILSWLIFDGTVPENIPVRAALSIVYLGVIGSVIGFALYYYVLKQIEASRVALITLITPVTALLLGNWLNNESLTLRIGLGAFLILSGLFCYELLGRKRSKI
ncbi:MAG: DMT family transporter [Gammaproteobacteria bacterium]